MTEPQLTTRTATVRDAPAIVAIYNEGIADRIATFETSPRSVDQILDWFDDRHPIVIVLDEAGEIAGYAATFSYADRCCYAGIAEFSVYVRRANRGQGVGVVGMKALIEEAAKAGFWKLLSRVFVENKASLALLRSVGFREVGVHEKHGKLDGDWRDVIAVELILEANIT
ncbi:arsinothricin resistance N-acetyltransferase ArsN1 family A [Caulobacter hibisci]|uniref:N-acetyltransferase n=1 Tax=Caulobacter hibisci TaxID=2035993 RepID=A0ABS0T213_9CAUL|nr:arsinothricin resistance N-acetyltransferase ArsN1 family A [Caulobacter hibisci]MBI1684907.1 N-acetyltransferase [Caulobacter hibisci]